jgi:hypothetical protein
MSLALGPYSVSDLSRSAVSCEHLASFAYFEVAIVELAD